MDDRVQALRSSVAHLRDIAEDFDDAQLVTHAYPSEWTIADVLSHIGSGAVIMKRRLDDALAQLPTPDDFAPGVWGEWNAKAPRAQAEDALVSDQDLLERMQSLTPSERSRFSLAMGPLNLDIDGFVGLRLNEHALHTWDIEVALDPAAVVPAQAIALMVDNLELIARFTAQPTGSSRIIVARTTEPRRDFTIGLTADRVTFETGESPREPDLVLPAEALTRLIYGRLDAQHTPLVSGDVDAVDELRRTFPGP